MQQNQGTLKGKLRQNWVFDYQREGEAFYRGILLVDRLSGVQDEIPLIVSENLLNYDSHGSEELVVKGSFRSRNKLIDGKSTLQLYFFVEEILPGSLVDIENSNYIHLDGFLCKPPVYRITPLNREICDILVAVNRNTRRSDYIPCIAWGKNANWLKSQPVGLPISIEGRIQSRKFTKQGDAEIDTRTAYEISITRISLAKN